MLLTYKQYIELLLKRMRIIGLPNDLVNLVSVWLKQRSFFVYIDGNNSLLYHVLLGKVQGSVLGLVNYAIFFSPLFDLWRHVSLCWWQLHHQVEQGPTNHEDFFWKIRIKMLKCCLYRFLSNYFSTLAFSYILLWLFPNPQAFCYFPYNFAPC